jgi:NAD(P) transhydrogenase subunit alpha
MLAAGPGQLDVSTVMGLIAVSLAAINVFGGFLVTQRMLGMFKKKSQ